MRPFSIHLVMRLVLAIAACSSAPALAQTREPQTRKPVRGWFGSGRSGAGQGQTLSLTGRVAETLNGQQDTWYPELQGSIRYDRKSRTRSLHLSADTSNRHFSEFGGLSSVTHDAAVGFATSLGQRTRLRFEHSVSKSPFYMVSVFAPRTVPESAFAAEVVTDSTLAAQALAELSAPELANDFAVLRRKTNSMTTALALSHSLGRHTAVTFDYGLAQSRSDDSDFTARSIGATFNQYLGRYAVARAGYTRRAMDRKGLTASDQAGVAASHDIDVGIDYNRPFSVSRRTTMVITTGSAIVPAVTGIPSANGVAAEGGAHYRVLGTASLNREFGRSWKSALSYGRNLEFVETFTEPLLYDNLALGLNGRFNRRFDLAVSASVSKGSVGFAAADASNRYGTYSGSARLRWATSRLVTTYAEYVAYGQLFGSGVKLPIGFGRDVQRSEFRVGLTVWAPLLR